MAALPRFADEANALQQDVTQSAEDADNDARAAALSANAAEVGRAAAASSADAASSSQQGASQKAAESRDSATLARQWATKLNEPVDAGEFSAKHYAQLAAQGMGLPIFPPSAIPTTNVGDIHVSGMGAMCWDGSRYVAVRYGHGQCRFLYVSPAQCILRPYNGDKVIVNGVTRSIPAAGVSIANTALEGPTGTTNYIYLYDNAGTLTLEASATGHSTHTNGVEIKTGDATRTLVGVAFKDSVNFINTAAVRGVASWFNRYYTKAQATNFNTGTASTTPVQAIGNVYVWTWAGEGTTSTINGRTFVSTAGASAYTYLYDDNNNSWSAAATSVSANAAVPVTLIVPIENRTEGFHSLSTYLSVSGGGTSNCALTQFIQAHS
ncbi:hypothetical protein ABE485_06325 [Achromobacter spanius]|uniref:hypothetical protein n=1 Tax=Achromobacter spanius TaxID=217203 RepID=UPI0032095C3E